MTDKINQEVHNSLSRQREGIMPQEASNELNVMYNKMISKPAYHFSLEYAKLNQESIGFAKSTSEFHRALWGRTLYQEASRDINQDLRLVELDPEMIPMIENTKNELFYRPLFFPSIFINCDFVWEDLVIKGFLITDHNQLGENVGVLDRNDWTIFTVATKISDRSEFYSNFKLMGGNVFKTEYHEYESERKQVHKMIDHVRQLALNIIDLVSGNADDVSINTYPTTRESNLKRIKRGKIQLPTRVYIKPNGGFRDIVKAFNDNANKFGYGHKFMVRGHWRHYNSERYKEKRGTSKWITPFWKGQGIAVAKDYIVKHEVKK